MTRRRAAAAALVLYVLAAALVGVAVLVAFGPLVAGLGGLAAAAWVAAALVELSAADRPAGSPHQPANGRTAAGRPAAGPQPEPMFRQARRRLWSAGRGQR
jgi:hypothetical protein